MKHREYVAAHQHYAALRVQPNMKPSELEVAAKELINAFISQKYPELLGIAVDRGLAYVLVGIGKNDQPFYLGPFSTEEEARGVRELERDRFLYVRQVQLGSLLQKGINYAYNWLASLFRREAMTR